MIALSLVLATAIWSFGSFVLTCVPQQDLAKDVKKELERLSTQLKKLVKDIGGLEGRLGNPGFADKAPADVVEATRAQLAEKLEQKATLDASIAELEKQ